jgi:signal transduction histidine kinase
MIEYTMNDNLNNSFGGSDAKRAIDEQNNKSFKHPLGNRDQRLKSSNSYTETADGRFVPAMNIQGAFRALEQLILHRQDSKELSREIVNVYTEMLHVDGACIYKYTTEGALEVLACNKTWSNIFSTLQSSGKNNSQSVLSNPAVLLHCTASAKILEMDQSSQAVPLSLGSRNYGSVVSLPLVCDGITVGAISMFSFHPQFFVPERIDILRTVAYMAASLYMNIQLRDTLEKEQIERMTLQKDVQVLHEQIAFQQQNAETGVKADAAYNELEALSYSVSHDLRAPIRAIRNNCEWLSSQHAAEFNKEGQLLLQQIAASSESMEKLLDGLLAFSKVVQIDPQQSSIDMTTLVRNVIEELMKFEVGPSSLSIAVQPLMPAFGDAILIRQVWFNLLSNAFKYTRYKQKREVIIDSHPFNGGVRYCVIDNGIGFDMQYVDRLFGAFHRLHVAEEFEGTGVGLAIVQRIIRRHGGQVWAEGKVDNGARFYFTLPKTQKTTSETMGTMQ